MDSKIVIKVIYNNSSNEYCYLHDFKLNFYKNRCLQRGTLKKKYEYEKNHAQYVHENFNFLINSVNFQEVVAIGELRLTHFSEFDLQEVKHEINVLK